MASITNGLSAASLRCGNCSPRDTVRPNMLKRSINLSACLLLAACASQPPSAPDTARVTTEQAAAAETVAAATTAPTAAPATPVAALAPELQQKMNEAAELLLAGQKDTALARYQAVQQAAPKHVSAWLNAALIKREQKKLDEALQLIESSLQHQPNEARALTLKGVVLREQGKIADAKAAYLAAVQANDNYAPAHRNLAVLADLYLDEPQLALRHMERYASLVGDDKQVNAWVTELRRRAQRKESGAAQ